MNGFTTYEYKLIANKRQLSYGQRGISPQGFVETVLPESIIDELARKVQVLIDKYSVTLLDVENQIKNTEAELSNMMDDLEGNEYDMKGLSELKSLLLGE